MIVADTGNHTIRKFASGMVSTLAGTAGAGGLADGTGNAARFTGPRGVAVDASGTIYVADTGNNAVRKVSSSGAVTTLATGFNAPGGVAVDGSGTVYVADTGNHVIRSISSSGTVSLVAGATGVSGSADGSATTARFSSPSGIAVASDGTLYVADTGNSTIRSISGGSVTTIGGSAGLSALADGTGSAARFNRPQALTLDPSGAGLYIADTGNASLRLGVVGTATVPTITVQPTPREVPVHGTVQLTCGATGSPSPTLQWQQQGLTFVPFALSNNETFSGVDTSTLTIMNAPASLNGAKLGCSAVNSAGSVSSNFATLTVNLPTAAPAALRFNVVTASDGSVVRKTGDQTVAVSWPVGGVQAWTATANAPWVTITNGSGTGSGAFTVGVTNPFQGASSSTPNATATVTVASTDPQLTVSIPVSSLRVTADAAPTGVFDTPVNNAVGIQGSIAVTGWALDDIEIDRVELWRDPVAGETTPVFTGGGPGTGKIFIANATFVPGARPDVESSGFGALPRARNAGWGYMLLTYGLWNQGNGTYTLYAFAFDKAGNSTTLGTKRITVDNAHATTPFGAIDTPGQGETISGTIQNFGWALTPGSSCTITNPNVQVSIDSGPLQAVVYGDPRGDIASAFPGYTNAAAGGGHYVLDTTTLANGLHTIGWLVTDSCGRADGVGSRFFTVANSSVVTAPSAVGRDFSRGDTPALKSRPTTERVGRSFSSGADVGRDFSPGETRVVRVGQNERVEVRLPGDEPYRAGPLPIGSTFDATTNTFMWQPAAGFLGAYDLQFVPAVPGVPAEAGSYRSPAILRVVVGPPIRMVIDTPHAGNVLSSAGFTVAGWAVDLGSLNGAGIDTLHVWAYPVRGALSGQGPVGGTLSGKGQGAVFVGVAQPGGPRPDVARLYGASFGDAGFTLTGTLAPGTYDLVVYAHSAATNTFAGAETVRIIVR